jgi:hypothetical protein
MAKYMLSYDARRVRNYQRLYRLLQAWDAKPLLHSLWVASLNAPAVTVMRIMGMQMDGDDGVVVTELTPDADWATLRANPQGVAALHAVPHRAFA